MRYQDYLATVSISSDELLEDWRWLIGSRLALWHVTKAGCALLRDPKDGSVHFLDTIHGIVEHLAQHEGEFECAILEPENAERWLLVGLVDAATTGGRRLAPDQCLSFKIPPRLGGTLAADNLEACSAAVHFSISGQIAFQVKDLPAGTKIRSVTIADGDSKRRKWWKFW